MISHAHDSVRSAFLRSVVVVLAVVATPTRAAAPVAPSSTESEPAGVDASTDAPSIPAETAAETNTAPAATSTEPAAAPLAEPVPAVAAEAPSLPSAISRPKKLLVMDLVDKGAGPEVTNALNQAAQTQAAQSNVGETVLTEQIRLTLQANQQQQMLGCDVEGCMAQLGQIVEADLVMGGNVASVAGDFSITILVVNPATGERVSIQQRKVPSHQDLYFYAVKQLVSLALTGRAVDPTVPVSLAVTPSDASAEIIVDGKVVALDAANTIRLDPGQHEVQVKADGYTTWKTSLTVEEASPVSLTVALVSPRIALWPAWVTVGIVSGVVLLSSAVFFVLAQDAYAGNIWLGPEGIDPYTKENSYLFKQPISTNELSLKQQEIQRYELLGGLTGGVGAILLAGTVLLIAGDVVFWALAE